LNTGIGRDYKINFSLSASDRSGNCGQQGVEKHSTRIGITDPVASYTDKAGRIPSYNIVLHPPNRKRALYQAAGNNLLPDHDRPVIPEIDKAGHYRNRGSGRQ
jgi:hypothetical protein